MENFKIWLSPCQKEGSFIGTAKGLTISATPPVDGEVTIQVSPHISDYQEGIEQPGVKIAQAMVLQPIDETITLPIKPGLANARTFCDGGKSYKIVLESIADREFEGQSFPELSFNIEELDLSDTQKTGSIATWLSGSIEGWIDHEKGTKFPPIDQRGLKIILTKELGRKFNLRANGPLGHTFSLSADIPPENPQHKDKIHVALSWGDGVAKLYLNGQEVNKFSPED